MDISPIHDFIVLHIGRLENTGSLTELCSPSKMLTYYTLSKSQIPSYCQESHQKTLYWKVVTLTVAVFHNSNFCLKAQTLPL